MELAKLLISYLENNTWALILLTFIIIIRDSISNIFNRLTSLKFSYGEAHGSIEAALPTYAPDTYIESKTDIKDIPEAETKEEPPADKEQPDWFSRLYKCLSKNETAIAQNIFEEEQRQELNSDKRHENEGLYLYFSFTLANDQSAIKKLESLYQRSQGDKQLMNATIWLSLLYRHIKDYESAANSWRRLETALTESPSKTEAKINLAKVEIESGNLSSALTLLETELNKETTNEQRSLIYEEISKIYKQKGNNRNTSIALEKSLEFSHGDRDKLFNAAYTQSNSNLNLLAAENYSTLISLDPNNSMALNNLGVCAGDIKAPGKQVRFYKLAAEQGNSLAMANLANLYMQSGFFDEAEETLKKALKIDDPHENVGNALYRLKKTRTNDEEMWEKALREAKELQRKIRPFGEALFDHTLDALDWLGTWITNNNDNIVISIDNQTISAKWDTSENTLGTQKNFIHSLTGIISNGSAELTYKKILEAPQTTSILGIPHDKSYKCLAYINTREQKLTIFSTEESPPFFMVLSRP
jgi:tetratricopeptide (TPR) repeat protein